MSGSDEDRVSAWEELRRRRVLRVATAYAAFAFALLEAVNWILGTGAESEQLRRALLGAAVLGFPLAVVLAFVYDVTPSGIVRTPEDATADPSYDTGSWLGWATSVGVAFAVGLAIRFFLR